MKNTNQQHLDNLSLTEKFALNLTNKVGTMGFFIIIFIWTTFWLSWNIVAPKQLQFDPYPAFVLWLFISNMIQIFLMPLIMIGQNLQGKHSELRAQNDFEVNLKAEKEIRELHKKIDKMIEEIITLKTNNSNKK